jgi:methyltransferase (TIGR00027 family)
MATVRVFEVDHPATQATKQRLLRAAVHPDHRGHVRLVPADLTTDDLGAALRAAGFKALERTVVVWEGVTNYLTATAVDTTIRRLAAITLPGRAGTRAVPRHVRARGGRPLPAAARPA